MIGVRRESSTRNALVRSEMVSMHDRPRIETSCCDRDSPSKITVLEAIFREDPMLRDESFDVESTWMGDGKRLDWKQIDRGLRELAKRRGALDLEEAQLLCSAVRIEVWRELGKATLLEYLEEVLGYGPRAAQDRVRVALALDDLPELADALATGELSYSAIRELTRVATPITQTEWRDEARGKNLRQIEESVAGRKKGDGPRDPVDPDLRPRGLHFEVRPATFALLRQAQQVLADERGDAARRRRADRGTVQRGARRRRIDKTTTAAGRSTR